MKEAAALDEGTLVNITDKAKAEIRAIFEREENQGDVGLRLGVVGGGCSGLSYQMEFSVTSTTVGVAESCASASGKSGTLDR